MIDTRAVAQEVQDQLLAAVRRGQEQLRWSQEQMRKSQEQMRKSQEAMAEAIRTGNELAKAVRPTIPSLPAVRIPSLSEPGRPGQAARQRSGAGRPDSCDPAPLAGRAFEVAGPLAEQVIAAQRQFADRAMQAASPVVNEQLARLTEFVASLPGVRKPGHGTTAESAATPVATPPVATPPSASRLRPRLPLPGPLRPGEPPRPSPPQPRQGQPAPRAHPRPARRHAARTASSRRLQAARRPLGQDRQLEVRQHAQEHVSPSLLRRATRLPAASLLARASPPAAASLPVLASPRTPTSREPRRSSHASDSGPGLPHRGGPGAPLAGRYRAGRTARVAPCGSPWAAGLARPQ